jgi:hypothetical protein
MKYREFWPKNEIPGFKHTSLIDRIYCKLTGKHSWVDLFFTYHGRKFEFCDRCGIFREDDKEFHKHAFKNKKEIDKSLLVGCFYCLSVFEPNQIKEWTVNDTAVCPNCSIDSLVGDASGYPIADKKFMHNMHDLYFGTIYTLDGKLVKPRKVERIKKWFRGLRIK